jgi:hypothetical protein
MWSREAKTIEDRQGMPRQRKASRARPVQSRLFNDKNDLFFARDTLPSATVAGQRLIAVRPVRIWAQVERRRKAIWIGYGSRDEGERG